MPVNIDENGIDVAFSCTQKGMSAPPGLSPITVSPRALDRLRARTTPIDTWYFDLKLLDEYFEGPRRNHHTAPITLFYALQESLNIIREEGVANRQSRHRRAHERLIAGLSEMGLEMLVPKGHRIWNLITPRLPEGVSDTTTANTVGEVRDGSARRIRFARGQSPPSRHHGTACDGSGSR